MVNFYTLLVTSISTGSNPNLVQVFVFIHPLIPTLRIHHMDSNCLVSCRYNLVIQHNIYHNLLSRPNPSDEMYRVSDGSLA